MSYEDEERTIVGLAEHPSLPEVIPGAPAVQPLEVVFERETLAPGVPASTEPYRAV